ncbi:ABC transporter substrate-binding protein [Catenulispora subtropica]|uniref:ABC transporter substrate-binding protein n=1 Tax=Catenulispora subtropica TaxID=450798 RepID=UPI0031D7DACA
MAVSNTRRFVAMVGVLATVTAAAACGSSKSSSGPKQNNITSSNTASTPTSSGPAAKQGGTARVAEWPAGSFPDAIWPFMSIDQLSTQNAGQFQYFFYRPLYFVGLNDKLAVNYDMGPADKPTWSSDGKTITVPMKSSWQWSNGEKVTGQDVQFWLNMMKAEHDNLGYYSAPNDVVGVKYLPDNIVSTKVSDSSIEITFDQPYNQDYIVGNALQTVTPMPLAWDVTDDKGTKGKCSADTLDSPTLKADCEAVWKYMSGAGKDVKSFATNPLWKIVDGPWVLKGFNATSGAFEISKNDKFGGEHKPYLDEVDFVSYTGPDAEWKDLQAGSSQANALQIGVFPSANTPQYNKDDLQKGNPLASAGYLLEKGALLDSIGYYQVNFGSKAHGNLFKQAYFTKVLQDEMDQQGAIDGPYKGWGYPTTGIVPGSPEGNPLSPAAKAAAAKYDPAEAKQLMTQHGWDLSTTPATCKSPGTGDNQCGAGINAGDKAEFTIEYPTAHPALDTVMQAYKNAAAKAGVAITVTTKTQNTLGSELVACSPDKPAGCQWDAILYGGWVYSLLPTADSLLTTGAGSNIYGFSDPKFDAAVAKTVKSSDPQAWYDYEAYASSISLPLIWMHNNVWVWAVAKGFHDSGQDAFQGFEPEFWYYTQ